MPSLRALARGRPTGRFQRMTAIEVIDEIKALPPQEKAKVIDFVQQLESTQPRVRTLDPRSFVEAARSVFQRHDQLMHKLSQ